MNTSKVELEGKRGAGREGKGNTTSTHEGGRRQGLFLLAAPVGMQLKELPNPGAASSSDFPSRTVFLVAFTPPVGNMKFQVI